jgi:ER-bound oxygenase mpaB/B'/Rubber oxygenase, catalytic domain
MNASIAELTAKTAAQSTQAPSIYGRIDFASTPERFTVNPADQTELGPQFEARRPELLANEAMVDLVRAFTLRGDPVADTYASLIPKFGFRQLVNMLEEACSHGVESVPSAPPELARFVQEMERFPEWLDAKLIERGARLERNGYAHRAPFVLRGALLGTFMNKYAALPMALTGALSGNNSGRRTKETATFYTCMVMPGVLDRHSASFKSAAMVRLMHSMVRFNLMQHGDRWDASVYGIPIPQIDQLPAGLLSVVPLSQRVLREGRTAFNLDERARVELARYRCFLLGIPRELLAETPREIVDIHFTRFATLRKGFDDTCGALVRATLTADLKPDNSLPSRFHAWLETRFARVYFVRNSSRGDKDAPAKAGVRVGITDYLAAAAASILMAVRMAPYSVAARIPVVSDAADRLLVRKLKRQLARYGHAEFTTNSDTYKPAHA